MCLCTCHRPPDTIIGWGSSKNLPAATALISSLERLAILSKGSSCTGKHDLKHTFTEKLLDGGGVPLFLSERWSPGYLPGPPWSYLQKDFQGVIMRPPWQQVQDRMEGLRERNLPTPESVMVSVLLVLSGVMWMYSSGLLSSTLLSVRLWKRTLSSASEALLISSLRKISLLE